MDNLYEQHQLPSFEFVNQSYTNISKTVFNNMFEELELMQSNLTE